MDFWNNARQEHGQKKYTYAVHYVSLPLGFVGVWGGGWFITRRMDCSVKTHMTRAIVTKPTNKSDAKCQPKRVATNL